MTRRYRIETYSGELLVIEVDEDEKDYLKIRLVGDKGEIKLRVKDIDEDKALIEIDKDIYRIKLHDKSLLINDENPLVSRIIELLPIGLSLEQHVSKKAKTIAKKGEIRAPLSGKINKILVNKGDRVSMGDALILMESMKMITEIKSDTDGIVEEIYVEPGQAVNKDTLLIKIKPLEEGEAKKKEGRKRKKKKK